MDFRPEVCRTTSRRQITSRPRITWTVWSVVIKAMQVTASVFVSHLRQTQMRETKDRVTMLNLKGVESKLRVGDKVLFYIPPTAEEAELEQ